MVYVQVEQGIGIRQLYYGYRAPQGAWDIRALQAEGTSNSLQVDSSGGIHVAVLSDEALYYGYMRRCLP